MPVKKQMMFMTLFNPKAYWKKTIVILVKTKSYLCPVVMVYPGSFSPSGPSLVSETALSHCHTPTILEQSSRLHSAWALWSLGYCTAINQPRQNSQLWWLNTPHLFQQFFISFPEHFKWKCHSIYNIAWYQHFHDIKHIFTT